MGSFKFSEIYTQNVALASVLLSRRTGFQGYEPAVTFGVGKVHNKELLQNSARIWSCINYYFKQEKFLFSIGKVPWTLLRPGNI